MGDLEVCLQFSSAYHALGIKTRNFHHCNDTEGSHESTQVIW